MESKYAQADKASKENLIRDFRTIESLENVKEIINALPYIASILNPERQIVYSNDRLLELLKVDSLEEILGYRVGEAINCIHTGGSGNGCGTSESCKYCGAVNTILKSQETKLPAKDECRIASLINGQSVNFDMLVMATPFFIKEKQYTILSLNDISSEKRRKALERIFFHDVVNTAGTLKGIIEIMKDIEDEKELRKFINLADTTSNELVEEIIAQRELIAAENNELQLKRDNILSIDLIRDAVVKILYNPIATDRSVIIDRESSDITFTTDVKLLRRVITNMLKNALEATPKHGKVKIGCYDDDNEITIWVSNPAYMPREIQLQIFLRSFSTKEKNRGLGTYSMKLLTEKYLGGKISFESTIENGTKFFVKLPL